MAKKPSFFKQGKKPKRSAGASVWKRFDERETAKKKKQAEWLKANAEKERIIKKYS